MVRDGRTIFESPVQTHGFNFTYQLESGNRSDLPSSGQVASSSIILLAHLSTSSCGEFEFLFSRLSKLPPLEYE